MGPIYDGLVHFLTSLEDLVPAFALSLFAGLRGANHGRRALFVLPGAWLLGGLLGLTASATSGSAFVSSMWFLLLGGLLAANVKLSSGAATVLAALLGLQRGYLNGAGMERLQPPSSLSSARFRSVRFGCARCRVRRSIARRVGSNRRARGGSWIAASGISCSAGRCADLSLARSSDLHDF